MSMSYTPQQHEPGSAERKIAWSERKKNAVIELDERFPEATWEQLERSIDGGVYDRRLAQALHAEIVVFRQFRWKPAQVNRNPRIRTFRSDLRSSILNSLQTIDHLSAVGAHHVEDLRSKEGRRWRPWFGQRLVANFGRAGFGVITGPPQKGKTNIGLYMGEQFYAAEPQKNVVLSNIKVFHPPDWYRHVDTLSGLFRAIVGRGPRKGEAEGTINPRWDPGLADLRMRWLWVFDEGGVVWKKKRATSNVSGLLETVAKHLGKNDGNIAFIEQTETGVPTIIEGFTRNRYRAIAPGVVRIQMGDREDYRTEWWEETVRDFPKAALKYDRDDRAPFSIDLDVDAMTESLAGSANQVAGIRRYLDRMDQKREETPKGRPPPTWNVEAVLEAREARVPWAQIALSLGIPVSTLQQRLKRLRRMKGGDGRPLTPRPALVE